MKNYVYWNNGNNKFEVDYENLIFQPEYCDCCGQLINRNKFENKINTARVQYLVNCLNELIRSLPVEYYDMKKICSEYIKNWDSDFPYYFQNQNIVKRQVCEYYNLRNV